MPPKELPTPSSPETLRKVMDALQLRVRETAPDAEGWRATGFSGLRDALRTILEELGYTELKSGQINYAATRLGASYQHQIVSRKIPAPGTTRVTYILLVRIDEEAIPVTDPAPETQPDAPASDSVSAEASSDVNPTGPDGAATSATTATAGDDPVLAAIRNLREQLATALGRIVELEAGEERKSMGLEAEIQRLKGELAARDERNAEILAFATSPLNFGVPTAQS